MNAKGFKGSPPKVTPGKPPSPMMEEPHPVHPLKVFSESVASWGSVVSSKVRPQMAAVSLKM